MFRNFIEPILVQLRTWVSRPELWGTSILVLFIAGLLTFFGLVIYDAVGTKDTLQIEGKIIAVSKGEDDSLIIMDDGSEYRIRNEMFGVLLNKEYRFDLVQTGALWHGDWEIVSFEEIE